MQRIGMDAEHIFADHPEISLINLCDSLAFQVKMVQAGIKNIKDYNPHKAKELFQSRYGKAPHTETIRHYTNVLKVFGFVEIVDGMLTFKRIKSQNNRRNYLIEVIESIDIKHLGKEISKFVFSSSMRAIGYVQELISRRFNPRSGGEIKHTRAKIRRLGFDEERFSDNGVSYGLLCRRFNISRHTVSELIKKCIESRIIYKNPHVEKTVIENAKKKVGDIQGFLKANWDSFTYYYYNIRNDVLRMFKVKANTYIYNPYCAEALLY